MAVPRPQTSIEGALYDLVARGKKDTFFQRDEATSINLFDTRYEPRPAYIPELRTIVPRNRVQWGATCEFEIEKSGDILIEPTLLINLPSWYPKSLVGSNGNNIVCDSDTIEFQHIYSNITVTETYSNINIGDFNTFTLAYGNCNIIATTTILNNSVIELSNFIVKSNIPSVQTIYDGLTWITVGDTTSPDDGVDFPVYTSTDFITWISGTGGAGITNSIVYGSNTVIGSNMWVAITNTYSYYSFNGSNWIYNTNLFEDATLNSINYIQNNWFISASSPTSNRIFYSQDPTSNFTPAIDSFYNWAYNIVGNGTGILVAVGNGLSGSNTIEYSIDNGSNWTPSTNGDDNTTIFFTNGNTIEYSTAIAYGNDRFIAADGQGSNLYTSAEGATFLKITTNTTYQAYTDIQYIDGSRWIAAAQNMSAIPYLLISDDNCQTWSQAIIQPNIITQINVYNYTSNYITYYTETTTTTTDTAFNPSPGNRYGYVNGVAYFLFEKIQFYQDNILLQEYSGDALFAQRQLRGSYNSAFLENSLTGVHDGSALAIQRSATPSQTYRLKIPLPFCQHPDEGGLPLCATESQQFRLRLTLRRLEDLVECSDVGQVGKPNPWNRPFSIIDSASNIMQFTSLSRYEMADPTLLLENRQLYIDLEAQKALSYPTEEYIIPYSRLYENRFTFGPLDYAPLATGTVAVSKRLIEGRHPAEQLYWYFRSREDMDANRLWKFEAGTDAADPTSYYNAIKLSIAGKDREKFWTSQVWQDIESHAKQERYSGRSIGSMNWSYGSQHRDVGPREYSPTGTLNFTSADRPTVYVDLAQSYTSNTVMSVIVDGYGTYSIREGRGGLLYAN